MDFSECAWSPDLHSSRRVRLTPLAQIESLLCKTVAGDACLFMNLGVVDSGVDAIEYRLQGRGCQLVASRAGSHGYNTKKWIVIGKY